MSASHCKEAADCRMVAGQCGDLTVAGLTSGCTTRTWRALLVSGPVNLMSRGVLSLPLAPTGQSFQTHPRNRSSRRFPDCAIQQFKRTSPHKLA